MSKKEVSAENSPGSAVGNPMSHEHTVNKTIVAISVVVMYVSVYE